MTIIDITTVDHRGRWYDRYEATRNRRGPGWVVDGFGNGAESYSASIRMQVARPAGRARWHPHWNCAVHSGWKTRREAQAVADRLNAESEVLPEGWTQDGLVLVAPDGARVSAPVHVDDGCVWDARRARRWLVRCWLPTQGEGRAAA